MKENENVIILNNTSLPSIGNLFSKFANLKILSLAFNQLEGVEGLSSCKLIEVLDLSHNNI